MREDIGKLLVRLCCGGLLILHGSRSLFETGVPHIENILKDNGLPTFLAFGNYIGEFFAPLLVIAGFKARIAAVFIALNMLLSVLLAHRDIMFSRSDFGGWMIELNVFYFATAVAIFLLGSGRYSISRGKGRWD